MPQEANNTDGPAPMLRTRLEPDLAKRVDAYIERTERSKSYLVRKAVEEFLERHEREIREPELLPLSEVVK